jgi:hypothetical protein
MDKDDKDNVIAIKPKTGISNPAKGLPKAANNQTNPIYKMLFKFIHTKLTDDKNNNLGKYKPEDIL